MRLNESIDGSCFVFYSICFFVVALFVGSCKLEKAYQDLNAGRYGEAREKLVSLGQKKEDHPAVQYGWALWYYSNDNPGYSLDSAQLYLQKARSSINSIDKPKKRQRYAELGVRPYLQQQLEDRLYEKAYQRARDRHTVEAYQHFISHYQDAPQVARARVKRNELAFERAKDTFTFKSFKEFVEQYPDAPQADEAKKKYELLLYKTKTREDTYEAYKQFMANHSNSPYYEEAKQNYRKKLYQAYAKVGTVESYQAFINSHPNHPKVPKAMDKVFELAIDKHSIDEYERFLTNHPDNRNTDTAWMRFYRLYTLDDRPATYPSFRKEYPSFPFTDRLARDSALSKVNPIVFRQDGKFGYVDTARQDTLIDALYGDAMLFKEGVAAVAKGDCDTSECKYGYIDKAGKTVIPFVYDDAFPFSHGVAIVGKGECQTSTCQYGLINHWQETVAPIQYLELNLFFNQRALAANRGEGYGYLNPEGEEVIAMQYKDATRFQEGKAAVRPDSLYGYINTKGEWLIRPAYEDADLFSGGLAPVALPDSSWGYIDTTGKMVIPAKYDYAFPFQNDTAKVYKDEPSPDNPEFTITNTYWINREGKVVEEK